MGEEDSSCDEGKTHSNSSQEWCFEMLENSTFESDSLKKGLCSRVTTELNVFSTSFKQLKQAILQVRSMSNR